MAGVFDIRLDGSISAEPGSHLDAAQRIVRAKLVAAVEHIRVSGIGVQDLAEQGRFAEAVAGFLREASFTTLNRFVALKMLEARSLVQECISRGEQSSGFKEFCGLAPGLVQLPDRGYRLYIESLFDEIGREVRVLFDRRDPASLLWPRRQALTDLLEILNHPGLGGFSAQGSEIRVQGSVATSPEPRTLNPEPSTVWEQDETIGWFYQYYNDPSERKRMRDESAAPRNSRELAVRNQLFTPRYVVEFLTDNSLGRIWYEMTRGETRLKEQCRYLVRRPNEIFLQSDDALSPQPDAAIELSQEELLQRPVEIPYRPLKDPRLIRMLDPACGSMHFGLYAFDLYQVIYEEAWDLDFPLPSRSDAGAEGLAPLHALYATKEDYLRDIPRLIIEHNIHGIDIDPRAAQIAGLSLWLRAQRAWQEQGLRREDRPRIRRSNIACAEPMPGEGAYLDEFIAAHLSTTPEQRLLGQLVRRVFAAMRLAGEAGSLLKIEDEIAGAVAEARQQWLTGAKKPEQLGLFGDDRPAPEQLAIGLDVIGITDAAFWEDAEGRIYAALREYAERTAYSGGYQRRLFADDMARGFAFIDLCRQRYDVALMNPPFGDASLPSKPYIETTYGDTKGDVYKAFVECFQARLVPAGYLGILSSRTGFFLGQSEDWRIRVVLRLYRPICLADLGSGVLDAMVEVAAYVLRSLSVTEARDLTLSLVPVLNSVVRDKQDRFSLPKWQAARDGLKRHQAVAELEHLETHGFIKRSPGDIVRYTPFWQAGKNVAAPPPADFAPMVCVRALAEQDKGEALREGVRGGNRRAFVYDPRSFSEMPGSPFAYWVGITFARLFAKLPPFESGDRIARQGGATSDDFRYLRTFWECSARPLVGTWRTYVKGGAYSPFYNELPLVAHWHNERKTFAGFLGRPGRSSELPSNYELYFRPGITWPLRARAFSPQVMPGDSIFTVRGYAILAPESHLLPVLGLTSSSVFDYLFKILLGRFGFPEFVVGVLQKLPTPDLANRNGEKLGELALHAWMEKRGVRIAATTSHAFVIPALLAATESTLAERAAAWAARLRTSEETVSAIQAEIDDIAFRLYGLDADDRAALTTTLAAEATGEAAEAAEENDDENPAADSPALAADLLAYALGCAIGRWDIRYATGERPAPEAPDPFAPLPVCPPGQLQNAQGLPAGPDDLPAAYPVDIPWDGILVDDPGHERDLTARSRLVFDIVFADGADAAWREATEILEGRGNDLRAWFARSFFPDHIKRYSKSRRKAPIYWQLATPSAGYSVWLYYHRFTRDTLYKVLNDSVSPKLQHEERKLMGLLQGAGGTPTANQRTEIAEQQGFVEELRAFREEVACVAPLWNPDLNDGVIINFAPLWRLVPQHRAWQKECKDCWDKLTAGDYDWAHLAMHLWPERVVPKCAADRSLAIAHGLEEAFWEEGDDGKWRARVQGAGFRIQEVIADLVRERTSAAVKDALNSLLEAPAPVAVRAGGRKPSGRTRAPKRVQAAGFSAQGSGLNHLNPVPRTPNPHQPRTLNPLPETLDAVRQAIASSQGGISKSEVLAATGLTDAQWNLAINALLTEGTVTKTGADRSTRYHLANAGKH
ncbi:Eco57I restriction-modification methylase domain-containing protein [Thiocapsa sp. N5-Cardenillas]|uniref:Eco57I restriction-modification methylase domain-containing protein n=1 Tax=Thiocapsa sp. N5-Cardenillas TaxID=3137397 RepID=UPI0035B4BAA9